MNRLRDLDMGIISVLRHRPDFQLFEGNGTAGYMGRSPHAVMTVGVLEVRARNMAATWSWSKDHRLMGLLSPSTVEESSRLDAAPTRHQAN